ncbi:MAG: NYN domain-containing protein [Rhodobacter sp.]|nr:NYN domain-containing protein [Rhodobacter sp.]
MNGNNTDRLAVLIDAENIAAKFAGAIFEEIATLGEASVRRLYCDVQSPSVKPWLDKQTVLGLVPIHQPKNTVGKNASDIALVIDAMDLLLGQRLDGFVLVSSDSDFTRLAQRIREQGVDVFGMGEQKTPRAFRMACKRFVTVENLANEKQSESDSENTEPSSITLELNHAFQLIGNVITDTNDPDGWASLAWLGSQLIKRYPDFDPRSYGHKRLTDLVRAIGRFEETGEGTDHKIRPKSD